MFVKMIDKLDHSIFERGRDGEEVEGGEMLDVLAESDAAGVGADGDAELCREQEDGQVFVDASYAATVSWSTSIAWA